MKKLMIAAAIVCAAAFAQASSVLWNSGASVPYFFNTSALDGNDSYAAGGDTMKASGKTFAYTLLVEGAGSTSGTVGFNPVTGAFMNSGLTIGGDTAISAGQTYNYTITITTSLASIGELGDWDYTAATATTVLTGTFDGKTGVSPIVSGVPASWTVTGAVAVPEPTSGLLLLLGVAGMALRRRRA